MEGIFHKVKIKCTSNSTREILPANLKSLAAISLHFPLQCRLNSPLAGLKIDACQHGTNRWYQQYKRLLIEVALLSFFKHYKRRTSHISNCIAGFLKNPRSKIRAKSGARIHCVKIYLRGSCNRGVLYQRRVLHMRRFFVWGRASYIKWITVVLL